MNLAALLAIVYGSMVARTGWQERQRGGHPLPSFGGMGLGGAAALGGLLMLGGSPAGRGFALVPVFLATLFFGWVVSQALLGGRTAGRSLPGLVASLVVAAALVLGARGDAP